MDIVLNPETSSKSEKPQDIVERTAEFADRVIKMSFALPHNPAGWEIARQVIRSAMSVGANV